MQSNKSKVCRKANSILILLDLYSRKTVIVKIRRSLTCSTYHLATEGLT